MARSAALVLVLALGSGSAFAVEGPHLGQPISEADLAPWNIDVSPDGAGLPPGSGTARQGAPIFAEKCAMCHGDGGKGGIERPLVGGEGTLAGPGEPDKTVDSYVPYATTIFDFIRRAMPWPSPRTLTNDEVYATTAYILAQDHIIGETEVMDAKTLPKVRMPNRNGFIPLWPGKK